MTGCAITHAIACLNRTTQNQPSYGSTMIAPVSSKSLTLRVTTVSPWTRAVAAIKASTSLRRSGMCSYAGSRPLIVGVGQGRRTADYRSRPCNRKARPPTSSWQGRTRVDTSPCVGPGRQQPCVGPSTNRASSHCLCSPASFAILAFKAAL